MKNQFFHYPISFFHIEYICSFPVPIAKLSSRFSEFRNSCCDIIHFITDMHVFLSETENSMAWLHIDDETAEGLADRVAPEDLISDEEVGETDTQETDTQKTTPSIPTYGYYLPAGVGFKRMVAILLAMFLGCVGAHKFYLGYTKEGIIMLVVFILGIALNFSLFISASPCIGFIDGIIYIFRGERGFYEKYMLGRRPWF